MSVDSKDIVQSVNSLALVSSLLVTPWPPSKATFLLLPTIQHISKRSVEIDESEKMRSKIYEVR